MSRWLDLSNSSNKLKQTYFSGFIDVSGNGVNIRNGELSIFDNTNSTLPNISISASNISVLDGQQVYNISNSKLIYIKDVSENIQERLTDLTEKTQNISASTSTITGNKLSTIDSDVSLNGHVSITGDVSFNNNVVIQGNLWTHYPANSIPQSAISGGVGGIYIPTEVTTFDNEDFALIKTFEQGQALIDASVNGNLSVSGTSNLNSALYVNSAAYFYGDVSMVGNLILNGNVYAPTQPLTDSSTKIATTEYVQNTLFRQFLQ